MANCKRHELAVLCAALLAAGCGSKNGAVPEGGTGLTLDAAKDAEYGSEWVEGGRVTLSDGEYRDSGARLRVSLAQVHALGDLNGDALGDAAVVLVSDPGGSGTFFDLAVLVDREGQPVNIASISLGDRVKLQSLQIENGRVDVRMVIHGPDDPMCCPTLQVLASYELRGGALAEVSRTATSGELPEGSDLQVTGEFKALGNEPFWNVEISELAIVFERMGDDVLVFPYAAPERSAGTYVYSALSDEPDPRSIEITIERKRCVDSMSGAQFDYSATVMLDRQVLLRGCAKAGARDADER